jgi:hypothetical protein
MARFKKDDETWLSVDEAAELLDVDECDVEETVGRHTLTRKKVKGERWYSLTYVNKKLRG